MIGPGEGSPAISYNDYVVYHLVLAVLYSISAELPIMPDDSFDEYSIRNQGEHRIYTFHLSVRDDIGDEELTMIFMMELEQYTKISPVKPIFFDIESYPHSDTDNWSSVYISVCE